MNDRLINDQTKKWLTVGTVIIGVLYFIRVALVNPGKVTDVRLLGGLISLQFLAWIVWDFRQRFFPVLMLAFLWAGLYVPFKSAATSGRWALLAAGAAVGLFAYLREHQHRFGAFHLVALVCMLSAFVSAMVSIYPKVALFKAGSMFLLFLYAATGARLAILDREAKFLAGMLWGCEVVVYLTALCYWVLHAPVFGNPNSLGVAMGVVLFPLLLWGVLISDRPSLYRRRGFALVLCLVLLLSSYARAGIGSATISSLFLCIGLRRYKVLIQGAVALVAGAILVGTFVPVQGAEPSAEGTSIVKRFLYKGKRDVGLLDTRKPVWDRTVESLQEHPWFGTGFGTSDTDVELPQDSPVALGMVSQGTREHGTSYLAITEWVGLLGVVPFLVALLLIAANVVRVAVWTRKTGNPFSPALPLAALIVAGLVDAGFEDWLFAAGYYACVLFWCMAFMLEDVVPRLAPALSGPGPAHLPDAWGNELGTAAARQ